MRTYDFTALFRSSGGIDRWNSLFDAALRADDSAAGYPPYNIEKTGDDKYRILMAVAGSAKTTSRSPHRRTCSLAATSARRARAARPTSIAASRRAFERGFSFADVKIVGATLADGVLQVDLEQELPEAMKPRHIAVEGTRPPEHF